MRLTEKSLHALVINSDEHCANKKKITQEELNNSLDDIAEISEQLKSSSISDNINNIESDP